MDNIDKNISEIEEPLETVSTEDRKEPDSDKQKKELGKKFWKNFAIGVLVGAITATVLVTAYFNSCEENCHIYPDSSSISVDKPVIYLYADTNADYTYAEVEVIPSNGSELAIVYPHFDKGKTRWEVVTDKDSNITMLHKEADKNKTNGLSGGNSHGDERVYNYLYWEGVSYGEFDFSEGFCIKGEDSASFLENVLDTLGLSPDEANEFIVYWLPKLEANPYNLISFQTGVYTDRYELSVTPKPDNMLRVFMAFKGLNTPIEVKEQNLEEVRNNFKREGFYVVEWGGSECH